MPNFKGFGVAFMNGVTVHSEDEVDSDAKARTEEGKFCLRVALYALAHGADDVCSRQELVRNFLLV